MNGKRGRSSSFEADCWSGEELPVEGANTPEMFGTFACGQALAPPADASLLVPSGVGFSMQPFYVPPPSVSTLSAPFPTSYPFLPEWQQKQHLQAAYDSCVQQFPQFPRKVPFSDFMSISPSALKKRCRALAEAGAPQSALEQWQRLWSEARQLAPSRSPPRERVAVQRKIEDRKDKRPLSFASVPPHAVAGGRDVRIYVKPQWVGANFLCLRKASNAGMIVGGVSVCFTGCSPEQRVELALARPRVGESRTVWSGQVGQAGASGECSKSLRLLQDKQFFHLQYRSQEEKLFRFELKVDNLVWKTHEFLLECHRRKADGPQCEMKANPFGLLPLQDDHASNTSAFQKFEVPQLPTGESPAPPAAEPPRAIGFHEVRRTRSCEDIPQLPLSLGPTPSEELSQFNEVEVEWE